MLKHRDLLCVPSLQALSPDLRRQVLWRLAFSRGFNRQERSMVALPHVPQYLTVDSAG